MGHPMSVGCFATHPNQTKPDGGASPLKESTMECFAYQKKDGSWGIGWGYPKSGEPVDKMPGSWETRKGAERAARFHNSGIDVIAIW